MTLKEIYTYLIDIPEPILDTAAFIGLADSLWFHSHTAPGCGLSGAELESLMKKANDNNIQIPSTRTSTLYDMRKELFKNEIDFQKIINLTAQL